MAANRTISQMEMHERAAMKAQAEMYHNPGNCVDVVEQLNHIPDQLRLLDNDNDGLSIAVDLLTDRLSGVMCDYPIGGIGEKCGVPEASMSTVACQVKHQRERVQQACARLRDILDRLEL